jgi:hypothetical protein
MCTAEEGAAPAVMTTMRQYLTRSRAAATSDATPLEKQKPKGPAIVLMFMSSSCGPGSKTTKGLTIVAH